MKEFFKKLFGSLETAPGGYSGRKLTAFFSIMVAACVTYTLPLEVRIHALYAWQALALLCLGIVTFEQIVRLKNGDKDEPKNPPV